jgi:subtilisin family serine protease
MVIGCPGIPQPPPTPQVDDPDRQVIVTLVPASPEHLARILAHLAQAYGLMKRGEFSLTALGIHCVRFDIAADRSIDAVIAQLAADPQVETVQRNRRFRGLGVIHNDQYERWQSGAKAIRADEAHRWATGKGVKVAVVDTGVAIEHPDLRGQIVHHATFVDGGERTFAQELHGTAVAGVIAALADNGIGIFGIAPEAAIVALKACWYTPGGRAECSSWTLCKALNFAIDKAEVQLLNLSLSGPEDRLLKRLLERAEQRGITVVAAAQKEGPSVPGFPASLETVIGVLASDSQGKVDGTAGRKRPRLLAAPGIQIWTTVPPDDYDQDHGSSLAAAHVTGVAALLLQQKRDLSPTQVRDLLYTTARPQKTPGGAPQPGIGVVDACAALGKLLGRRCP